MKKPFSGGKNFRRNLQRGADLKMLFAIPA